MDIPERQLHILLSEGRYSDATLEKEILFLNQLLGEVETMEKYIAAVELLDMNRGGICHRRWRVEMALAKKRLGAFQFLIHKN